MNCLARLLILTLAIRLCATQAFAQTGRFVDLARLTPGRTKAVNALWVENPVNTQFLSSNRIVVAEIKGPAEITMMHFAYPGSKYLDPSSKALNRALLLRIYWDGESNPSVDCPLVDFFCDPDGTRDVVNTAMVNVRRGFNAYFPMPFRKSAKVELVYDGPVKPGPELQNIMPCYSYVCYRTLKRFPADTGYFCASWRQEALKMGIKDYVALEAKGKGKLVGWNITVRWPGRNSYPVDENEKFYIDGETNASVEFQGLEDSFGFSWGFPSTENMFPLTGWFPFLKGAAAYRFFLQDSISFEKSLKVTIGPGEREEPLSREFSKFGTSLQFSSTVYWYQTEPHAPLPPMPPAAKREPAPEKLFWPEKMPMPSADELKARGVKLAMFCGLPGNEIIYHEPGYSVSKPRQGFRWNGWAGKVFYCRADPNKFELKLNLPKQSKGILRLYIIDPDNYLGGRKETIVVGGQTVGTFDNFQNGRWIEVPVGPEETAGGKLSIQVVNARDGSNAVLSKIEWVEK
jgi:Protein of unknown function (DUF2961)